MPREHSHEYCGDAAFGLTRDSQIGFYHVARGIAPAASGLFAGLAGGFYASYVCVASPNITGFGSLTLVLSILLMGGPVSAAFVVVPFSEALAALGPWRDILPALTVIAVMVFYPGNNLNDSLASAASSMTIDGKQWGVPYTYYQWGIYYNKDVYKTAGVEVPKTWDEFIANCAVFQAAGIDCLTTGSKALWPTAGIFDYLNLRTNGYEFHMQLTSGEISWTDDRVKAVFAEWAKVVPYTTANHAAIDWQDAAALLVQGKAANYVMGNFAVATFKDGGMTNDSLGFMPFPEITPGLKRAEEAPTDTIHIPAGAKNVADAKKFLAFVASAEVQTKLNEALGQLPINKDSKVGDDPFLQAGFALLSTAEGGIAQFFDRDASAEMAKTGMEGFQEFMIKPERLDDILERLEKTRLRLAD